jgi:hypothetical protein
VFGNTVTFFVMAVSVHADDNNISGIDKLARIQSIFGGLS